MYTSFTDRSLTSTVFAVILTSLSCAILPNVALAQTPSQGATGNGATGNGARELELDGQPPSNSAPSASQTPREENEIDNQNAPSWQEREEDLQQQAEQQVEENLDSPPPGSVTPEQDSPDQLEIPL